MMAMLGTEVDANFFNLIHQAVQQQKKRQDERRVNSRQAFQSYQRIALPRGSGVPAESEFFEVQCHDLTTQGFSFLLPFKPKFQKLVASLGTPPESIYLSAQVTRCTDVIVYPSGATLPAKGVDSILHHQGEGSPMVLVGCKFIERMHTVGQP